MNGSQNYLEPHPQILVKLFILGCSSFRVLREYGGDDFLGHVLSPRIYVVDSSSPNLFHIQKRSYGFLSDYRLDAQNVRNNVVIIVVSESPKFLHQVCIDGAIETVEVSEPTLIVSFLC